MASLSETSLQKRLDKRKGTMSEVDRSQYEKQQTECITKAVKNEEVPAKEKHVRLIKLGQMNEAQDFLRNVKRKLGAIIGTWQERGNSMFWSVLGKQPLPSQAVACWKSLMVMHKILQEGHPNVIKDSYKYKTTLRDLFSVYRFQAGIYGPLICEYLKILQSKLEMHHKYPGIPGGLTANSDNPLKIPQRDINILFTFCIEALDYQDLLLTFEENIFKTLDKSKNNSQIGSSQCRIAALVPVLKECSGIYDMLVLSITKLHKNLPPDSLDGHRQRFYKQHGRLKTFCFESSQLQYVTNLIAIPNIPESPPDFLKIQYTPKTKTEPPKEEPKPEPIAQQVDERDILIEQLMREIEELRLQLEATQQEAMEKEKNLNMQIIKLKEELKRIENIGRQFHQENAFLKEQLEQVGKEDNDAQDLLTFVGDKRVMASCKSNASHAVAVDASRLESTFPQLCITEPPHDVFEKAKSADEKFNKLKVLYGKLRQDHIELLRKNGEIKQKEEAFEKANKELEEQLQKMKEDINRKDEEIQSLTKKLEDLEQINQKLKIDFDQTDESSKAEIVAMIAQVDALKKSLNESESKCKILEEDLARVNKDAESQIKSLQDQLDSLTTGKITEETARKSAEDTINKLRDENEATRSSLEALLSETRDKLSTEESARKSLEEQLQKLREDSSREIGQMKDEISQLQSKYNSEVSNKEGLETELARRKNEYETQNTDLTTLLNQTESNYTKEATERKRLEDELQKTLAEFQEKIASLNASLGNIQKEKDLEEANRKEKEADIKKLQDETTRQLSDLEKQHQEKLLKAQMDMLASTANECEKIIHETLDLFENTIHESGTTCNAEYLKSRLENLTSSIQQTTGSYSSYHSTNQGLIPLLSNLQSSTHLISDALINGKATAHMAKPEDSQHLVSSCKDVGKATLTYLQGFKTCQEPSQVQNDSNSLEAEVKKILKLTEDILSKEATDNDVGNMVDEEMHATEKIVADAASRIEEMLNKSRKHHSGVQLEVNERILDSCTALMKAIRELILKSKDLQEEIVAEGKGSATAKEFYKRHHKWTEGLLSAAKSVGWGATILVDAADKVIERKGKFEELVVASHEIAASTAQLVAASRVKANKNSKKLPPLMTASKSVGEATAGVVAAVKSGASMTEESKTVPDYSKMTLTQAKRLEMDSQVKVLELEDMLEKERTKLGKLRKAHYQLAVELYGEEEVNMPA